MPMILPATTAPTAAPSRVETAIIREINRVRRHNGLRTVRADRRLRRVARAHSVQMLSHHSLSHDSFTGLSFVARLGAKGSHKHVGETLAWMPSGTGGAPTIVRMWLKSAPHRAVLLDGRLRHIGIGRVRGVMGRQRGAVVTADWSS